MADINFSLFRESKKYIASGVNSPVRSFKAVGGSPVFVKKANGDRIFGEDAKSYIDYCLSWGALLLGHSHPRVVLAAKRAIENGTSYGAATKKETEFARIITGAIPSVERLRLVNSGTEAAMSAVRLARGYTGKNKIIKFKECYHGHSDYFLAGKSAGIPRSIRGDAVNLDYNNLEDVEDAFKKDRDIACVIVEPVAANKGLIPAEKGFLEGLRKLTKRYGALLIFDEVITGFRFCFGGIQNIFKIKPDLTCLGKIIGGGFPLAGFGGKREIMRHIAPEGSVYQAGTLAGNPVAVSAGIETLNLLKERGFYEALRQKSIFFYGRLIELMEKSALKAELNHFDSMFSLDFKDSGEFRKLFHLLLCKGIYLSPAPDEVCFLSGAHTQKDLDYTVNAVDYALKNLH